MGRADGPAGRQCPAVVSVTVAFQSATDVAPVVSVGLGAAVLTYLALYVKRIDTGRLPILAALLAGLVGYVGLTRAVELLELSVAASRLRQFHLALVGVPVLFGLLAFSYTGRDERSSILNLSLLGVVPLVTYAVVWTSVQSSLPRVDTTVTTPAGGALGRWYLATLLFGAVTVLAGSYLLVRAIGDSERLYRGRTATLFLASLSPLVGRMALDLGVDPTQSLPVSGAAAAVGVVAVVGVVERYQMVDTTSVARNAVIENMRDGFVLLDINNRIIDLNPAARALVDDPDPIGSPADDVIPQTEELLDRYNFADQVQQEIVVDTEEGDRHYDVQISSLYDERFIGRLMTMRNITRRRAVEKRYQTLIENSSDVITVLDADGTVQYQSPSVERVLGYNPEELVEENFFEFVHPDDRERVQQRYGEVVDGSERLARFEYRFKHKNEVWRVLEGFADNLLDNTFVGGVVVNARDITRRKLREQELKRTNERLDEFASIVSHDLRNPLNVADGYVQTAREVADDQTNEYLAKVEDSHDRMEDIIEDVLTLARQGDEVEETSVVVLYDVVEEAWANVDTPEASFQMGGDREFEADPDRLLHLFENLFRNAIEHGGEDVTVRVGATGEGFYVEDDGPGIPEDQREDVLESGFTTSREGTGFGLAIVQRVAEAHGWEVEVGESENGGARFTVTGVVAANEADAVI